MSDTDTQVPLQDLQVAHHHLQQVVEVVRDAARELANGLHLLRLTQLLLSPLKLGVRLLFGGDVPAHTIDHAPTRGGRPGDPAVSPVLAPEPVLERRENRLGRVRDSGLG